jgi:hypothetical protein
MKISTLIQDIVQSAEDKFGFSDHINDCISIEIYFNGETWMVSLMRPSQRSLDLGEVDNLVSVKLVEECVAFHVENTSFLQALLELQHQVDIAGNYDFETL